MPPVELVLLAPFISAISAAAAAAVAAAAAAAAAAGIDNAGGELHSVTVQRGLGAGGSNSFIGAMPVKKAVMLLWRCGMQCWSVQKWSVSLVGQENGHVGLVEWLPPSTSPATEEMQLVFLNAFFSVASARK
jgi:hypothetical protein